jgi:predicted Rossmann fold flavoprotein
MNIKEKKSFDVLVIGGGAAGMMAAITAASNGADTVILEHKDRVGKKILSTGNGKCNYTNEKQGVSYYRGDNPAFVVPVMEQFGFAQTIEFFQRLGIYPKNKNGYYYPASEQAASVLDVLRMELSYRRVSVVTECEVTTVEEKKNGFVLETGKGRFFAKKIIFATKSAIPPASTE